MEDTLTLIKNKVSHTDSDIIQGLAERMNNISQSVDIENPLSLVSASIKRSFLVLCSGIHQKNNINLEDLKKASFLSSEDLQKVQEEDLLNPQSMFNKAYTIIARLNSDFKPEYFNSFAVQWAQNDTLRNQVLHPTETQVHSAAMKLSNVLEAEFSTLTYDQLLLLDSFCYQYEGIASVVFTPSVASTLGFKAFFLLHEKYLVNKTPKSNFSSVVKEKLNVLKWKKYFSEKKPFYMLKPPVSSIYSMYYYSNKPVFKLLRSIPSIDPQRQKKVFRILGSTSTLLPLSLYVKDLVQNKTLVRSQNTSNITPSEVLKMILQSREGTGILKPIELLISKLAFDLSSVAGSVSSSVIIGFLSKHDAVLKEIAKILDEYFKNNKSNK